MRWPSVGAVTEAQKYNIPLVPLERVCITTHQASLFHFLQGRVCQANVFRYIGPDLPRAKLMTPMVLLS